MTLVTPFVVVSNVDCWHNLTV